MWEKLKSLRNLLLFYLLAAERIFPSIKARYESIVKLFLRPPFRQRRGFCIVFVESRDFCGKFGGEEKYWWNTYVDPVTEHIPGLQSFDWRRIHFNFCQINYLIYILNGLNSPKRRPSIGHKYLNLKINLLSNRNWRRHNFGETGQECFLINFATVSFSWSLRNYDEI